MGAKDSSGDWDNLQAYIRLTQDLDKGFKVLSGNDSLILKSLQAGGAGGIAGCSNVYPTSCPPSTTCSWKARSRKHRLHRTPLQASVLCSSTATPTPWSRGCCPAGQPGGRMPPSLLLPERRGHRGPAQGAGREQGKGHGLISETGGNENGASYRWYFYGRPFGNGPEITVKALNDPEVYKTCRPLVVGIAPAWNMHWPCPEGQRHRPEAESGGKPAQGRYEYGTIDLIDLGIVPKDKIPDTLAEDPPKPLM